MNLLLVEDDRAIGSFLRRGIEGIGYCLDWTLEGRVAIEYASVFSYDAVILDLMLPDMDGLEVCGELRKMRWNLPILILSARDQVSDRVKGLSSGADDFLVKPFAFDELLARLTAIQRRNAPVQEDKTLTGGSIVLDRESRTVVQGERVVDMTSREYQLLEYLMKNKNKTVSRAAIINQVWGVNADVCDNSVDVYVGYLRRKLALGQQLATVRGIGFRLALG